MSKTYRPGFGSMLPPVIKFLLISNIGIFILTEFFGSIHIGGATLNAWIRYFLYLYPFSGGEADFWFWQLITYQFLHGGFVHLLFNMFALWMFGVEIEHNFGSRKFLIFYLMSGIGAGLVQLLLSPMFVEPGMLIPPTIGASGSIFGVLVAFALMFPNRPIFMFPIFIPIPAKYFVMGYAAINIVMALNPDDSGVAWFAHLGGAAAGFLLFKYGDRLGIYRFFEKIFKSKSPGGSAKTDYGSYDSRSDYYKQNVYNINWEQRKAKKEESKQSQVPNTFKVDGEDITQSKIDEILDKISRDGYQSLTDREKQILFELSQKLK